MTAPFIAAGTRRRPPPIWSRMPTPCACCGRATSWRPTPWRCWDRPSGAPISPTETRSARRQAAPEAGLEPGPRPRDGIPGRPLLLSRPFVARSLPSRVGPLAQATLAVETAAASAGAAVAHVPRILARTVDEAPDLPARAQALDAHLSRHGAPARATVRDGAVRLDWPLPEPAPKVSIVIPSRDGLELITRVCRGVLHETAYPLLELIIIDNGSTDPAVLAHYETLRADPRVRIRIDPQPFNFAAMVNAGVAEASGMVVVLLNNDVAVLDPGWLDAMVRQACRPDVGAVGAKLLYGDGTLQHAGVVVGLGGRAGHILRRRPGDTPGHLGRLRVAHEVAAVTAACLAVSREKYRAVGGFDAEAFPVDFNDVDFASRLGAAGWKTVWTPDATSRISNPSAAVPRSARSGPVSSRRPPRFSERWRDVIRHDPFYHPALSLTTFGEDLNEPPPAGLGSGFVSEARAGPGAGVWAPCTASCPNPRDGCDPPRAADGQARALARGSQRRSASTTGSPSRRAFWTASRPPPRSRGATST
ncbi:glycosyltransferase family 2 protein [Methylobacterium oryzae CBMB20]